MDGFTQRHAFLKGKDDAAMMGISFPQDNKISYIVGKNGATLGSRAEKLLFIIRVQRHPICGGGPQDNPPLAARSRLYRVCAINGCRLHESVCGMGRVACGLPCVAGGTCRGRRRVGQKASL
jgi:hypothetical protein